MLTSSVARLPKALPGADDPAFALFRASATGYNASRLGLAPPVRAANRPSQPKGRAEYTKKTFKMPRELHNRLRDYCLATHQFQYALICEGVSNLLSQVMAPEDVMGETVASQVPDHPEDMSSSQAPAQVDRPGVLKACRRGLVSILRPLRAVRAMLLRLRA